MNKRELAEVMKDFFHFVFCNSKIEIECAPCVSCKYFLDDVCLFFKEEKYEDEVHPECYVSGYAGDREAFYWGVSELDKYLDKYLEIYKEKGLKEALQKAFVDLKNMLCMYVSNEEKLLEEYLERLRV